MSKILVVEDNALNMKLFHDLLATQSHTIITSSDGIGIQELSIEHMPDLILMDIQLNGISGIDLIRELKKNSITKEIPIIAITAFAMHNDETRISSSGCDLYLSKPVSIDDFFEAVDKFTKNKNKISS